MTDNAARRSKAAATANEQTINATTQLTKIGVNTMVDKKTNTYELSSEVRPLEHSAKAFTELMASELLKPSASAMGVGYALYWRSVKDLNKEAFAFKGVAHYMLAANRFDTSKLSESIARYEAVANHLETMYAQYDEHVGYLNVFLHSVHAKLPSRDRNGKQREEYKPLAFEPFTRRILQDGVELLEPETEDDRNLLLDHGIDPDDEANMDAYRQMMQDEEVKRFMQQAELKSHKANVTQALDSEPRYITEPITKEQWIEDMVSRDLSEIKADAKIGAWAMAKAVARRSAKLPEVKDLVKGSQLESIDWARAKGGAAMSLAVKAKSRVISSLNFIDSMRERKEYLINTRLRKEAEDMGTIGESSLAVSGAVHDEQIAEIEGYIKDSEREIEVLKGVYLELYTVFRRFGTTVRRMPLTKEEIPLPDYRTAFQRDPEGYEGVPEDAHIAPIEVDVERNGKVLKKTIWLVTAFGPINKIRKIAEDCRKVRYEMTKYEQVLDINKMGVQASEADTVSVEELASLIDGLM